MELLIKRCPEVKKNISSRTNDSTGRNVVHLVFANPKGEHWKDNVSVMFEKETGYTNSYRQIKTCVSNGDEEHLLLVCNDTLADIRAQSTLSGQKTQARAIIGETY